MNHVAAFVLRLASAAAADQKNWRLADLLEDAADDYEEEWPSWMVRALIFGAVAPAIMFATTRTVRS